eukprot:gnl/TRDRNA2_/TRDRNA2_168235_c0_seq1.p1 gnl/TRDRNA2_/TRDRNA2_168235_c0~~gnl/TRDRNA2_/TRDRNA2_168235_c0_seq1.p1  ORF type:complete len:287 (+),score=52.58 gnl/TRDRNA2_/TRDRNA2_168235_c0_seq1:118-978(+)
MRVLLLHALLLVVGTARRDISSLNLRRTDDVLRGVVWPNGTVPKQQKVSVPLKTGFASSTRKEESSAPKARTVNPKPARPGYYGTDAHEAILCFGDSLTEGYCKNGMEMRPYSEQLEMRLNARGGEPLVFNAGISGERADLMTDRLPNLLSRPVVNGAPPFDLVLILGGTNDLPHYSAEEILADLMKLHETAFRAGAHTGTITIPDIRYAATAKGLALIEIDRLTVNKELRKFAHSNRNRTFLIDLANEIPNDLFHTQYWEADGVHFTEKGYKAFGDLVAETKWVL